MPGAIARDKCKVLNRYCSALDTYINPRVAKVNDGGKANLLSTKLISR